MAPPSAPEPAEPARSPVAPESLAVREGESPWTPEELEEVRNQLRAELDRLKSDIDLAEEEIADLISDSGEGAGDDQADAGSKAFEREHEMSLANNAREMLGQSVRALQRIDSGTYGICESCGNPIGKARLQAFPRATLCMTCKQREERR
jgi:DnaK suppressor protein